MSDDSTSSTRQNRLRFTTGRLLAWTAAIASGFGLAVAFVGHPLDYNANNELQVGRFLTFAAGLTLLLVLLVERQWVFGGLLVILGLLFIALDPGDVRLPKNQNSCSKNLQQLAQALLDYEATFRRFPQAGTAPAYPYSWRVAILPYVGQQALYDEYRFHEPWNGPINSRLAARMPDIFRCPSDPSALGPDRNRTSYLAVTGNGTLFPSLRPGNLRDARAGISETVMLVEVSDQKVPWTRPDDITLDELLALLSAADDQRPAYVHRTVTHAAFGDGSVQRLSVTQGPWRQLLAMQAAAENGER